MNVNPNVQGVNVNDYLKRKKAGKIVVTRVAPNVFSVLMKNYDPGTGDEIDPALHMVKMDQLEDAKEQLVRQRKAVDKGIRDIEDMIKDFKSTKADK